MTKHTINHGKKQQLNKRMCVARKLAQQVRNLNKPVKHTEAELCRKLAHSINAIR